MHFRIFLCLSFPVVESGGGFGGNRGFGGRDGGRPQMHKAVCNKCGQDCEVPFRPTGERPVFCVACFGAQKHEGAGRMPERAGGKSFDRPSFGDKRMFDAICDKCGNNCQVPFRPSGEKPVYCSQCFDRSDRPAVSSARTSNPDQYKEQFKTINSKLDKILKLLNPVVVTEAVKVEPAIKKKAATKTTVKKVVVKKKKK